MEGFKDTVAEGRRQELERQNKQQRGVISSAFQRVGITEPDYAAAIAVYALYDAGYTVVREEVREVDG